MFTPENSELERKSIQRILEHLEWKLLGDFSKSKTIQDSKEAL